MVNVNVDTSTPDSPRVSMGDDFYQVLSGLSHACQLLNVIAFYLHIHLPFRLHQWYEFGNRKDCTPLSTFSFRCHQGL